jgi:hypothetical protein
MKSIAKARSSLVFELVFEEYCMFIVVKKNIDKYACTPDSV